MDDHQHTFSGGVVPALLLGAALLAGCAGFERRDPAAAAVPQSARELRVREVFVYQGRVANDLLERYQFDAAPGAADDPVLTAAEADMTERCTYLNQAAVSYLEGGEPGWRLKMKMLASVDACEAAARDVARLLATGSPAMAVSLSAE